MELYEKIKKELEDKKYLKLLYWIYKTDKAIDFDDVVSDVYIKISENRMTFEDINEQYLRNYRSLRKRNYHVYFNESLAEDMSVDDILSEIKQDDINLFNNLALTKDETNVLLYCIDNKNIKNYNIESVLRKDKRGVDYTKLSKKYEIIIKKLLNNVKDG